jgi:hypothetical protein
MRLLAAIVIAAAASAMVLAQPAASVTVEQLLTQRLGIDAAGVNRFTGGNAAVVWSLPATADNEVAATGAIRVKGDLRRLVVWLRDIESFMRATGTVNVGAIASPATVADFGRITLDTADVNALKSCVSKNCSIRMPPSFIARFQNEVAWSDAAAQAQATTLGRTLISEYVAAYQKSGDAGSGAFHDPANPLGQSNEFRDMLRQSTKAWDLDYPFVQYLETYPAGAPAGTENRFYWTRDKMGRNPVLTLHHVVLQELAGGRIMVADKQFYASRDFDAGLMFAFGVPNADYTSLDLVVSVKVRSGAMRGVAARVLRGRIEKEVRNGLTTYLEWIRDSFAL